MVDSKPIYPISNPNYNSSYNNGNNSLRYPLAPPAPLYNNTFIPTQPLMTQKQPMQIPHIINTDVNQNEELKRKRLASE